MLNILKNNLMFLVLFDYIKIFNCKALSNSFSKNGLILSAFSILLFSAPQSNSNELNSIFYDFSFNSIDGELMPMSAYKNKVVLIVNTASKCGYTGQYDGLQKLWENYKNKGLVVLGIPTNDFFQEPGKESDIKKFCSINFNVNFPMTSKISIVGKNAHDFYKWAAQSLGPAQSPKWNFHKYLLSHKGKLLASFSSAVTPDSKIITESILDALSRIPENRI